MEIERKYLIKTLPENPEQYESIEMVQGYLNTEPVVRVRRENDRYVMTYKSKGLIAREEYNLPLNEEAFAHLIQKADGIVIEKTRYLIPLEEGETIARRDKDGHLIHGGKLAELDIFHGVLEGLKFVEVEFDSIEQANAFVAPSWFGEDVSESGNYQNSKLSQFGIPKEYKGK